MVLSLCSVCRLCLCRLGFHSYLSGLNFVPADVSAASFLNIVSVLYTSMIYASSNEEQKLLSLCLFLHCAKHSRKSSERGQGRSLTEYICNGRWEISSCQIKHLVIGPSIVISEAAV